MVLMYGRCPKGTEIRSVLECNKAATSAMLGDTSATWTHARGTNVDPPFCYYEDGELKLNSGRNTGFCSSSDVCLGAVWRLNTYHDGDGSSSAKWDEEDWHTDRVSHKSSVAAVSPALAVPATMAISSFTAFSRSSGILCIFFLLPPRYAYACRAWDNALDIS